MPAIKVLIVEDQVIVSEEIKEILLAKGYEVIGQCINADETMQTLAKSTCDIVIMDINIDGPKDGITLAKEISRQQEMAIIFLTAYSDDEFLSRAKEVEPAAYIVKPFQEANLHMAIEIAFTNLLKSGAQLQNETYQVKDFIFVKDQSRYRKIRLEDILFAEADGSYTKVVTTAHEFVLSINLKTFESQLDAARFMRVHRSYVVSLQKVEEYEGNRIFLNKRTIPVSASFKEDFLRRFTFL